MTKPRPSGTPDDLVRRARGRATALSYADEPEASELASFLDELAATVEAQAAELARLPEPREVWGVKWGNMTRADGGPIVGRRRNEVDARVTASAEVGDVVMRRLVYPPYRTDWAPADD